jgi:heme a synthase
MPEPAASQARRFLRRARAGADLLKIAQLTRRFAALAVAPALESLSAPVIEAAISTSDQRRDDQRAIAWWLAACAAMIFLMVLIGGITRLTESGLSITEWQPISGILPPIGAGEWQDAFAHYRAIPQFHVLHPDMSLDEFKAIYFWEYLHRLWGRLIGLAFAAPFVYFLARGMIGRELWPKLAVILALGALQGVLGWYMVESGLETRIEVSQYRLAAHFLAALLIYGAILWVAFDLFWPRGRAHPGPALVWALDGLLALVTLTAVAGAFVAGLRGGAIYNTFPLMGDSFAPSEYGAIEPWYLNWFENPAAAQFDHRLLAETTWAAIVLTWFFGRGWVRARALLALDIFVVMATIQATLGVVTLLSVVAAPLAVAHQAGAALLVTAALFARHTIRS